MIIFWEPEDQQGTRVRYVGHWKVTAVKVSLRKWKVLEMSNLDMKLKQELQSKNFKGEERCAKVTLRLERYDKAFGNIIDTATPQTCSEIEALVFYQDPEQAEIKPEENDAVVEFKPEVISLESDAEEVPPQRKPRRKRNGRI